MHGCSFVKKWLIKVNAPASASSVRDSVGRRLFRFFSIVIIALPVWPSSAGDSTRSQVLRDKFRTELEIRRFCGPSGRRSNELELSLKSREAIRKSPFILSWMAACNGAHDALQAVQILLETLAPQTELFEFWFYIEDYSDLDKELYQRHLLGPFLSNETCLASQKRFEEAGSGMTKCRRRPPSKAFKHSD